MRWHIRTGEREGRDRSGEVALFLVDEGDVLQVSREGGGRFAKKLQIDGYTCDHTQQNKMEMYLVIAFHAHTHSEKPFAFVYNSSA